MKHFARKQLIGLLLLSTFAAVVSCTNEGQLVTEHARSTVTSGYWKNLLSIGPKTNASATVLNEVGWTAQKCAGTSHCIRLEWSDFALGSGTTLTGYNVYRNTSDSFNLSSPIATTTNNHYIDTSALTLGGVYYYKVAAVIDGNPTWGSPGLATLKVVKPPANSAFVHRWMANLEMCTLMGLGIGTVGGVDVSNDYRCAYAGFGHTLAGADKYYDFGKNLIVDRFELGCNFSRLACSSHDPGDGSTTTDCVGTADPSGMITAGLNQVFFQRATGRCWLNTDGATAWTSSNNLTTATDRLAVSRSAADLPPIARLSSQTTANFCSARSLSIGGNTLNMRIPRRSEFMVYAAWPEDVSQPQDIEAGLSVDGNCNSDSGHSLTFNLTYPPANPETLAGNASRQVFTSGSSATRNCVTRYGIQDALGNWHEWTSTQTSLTNAVTSLVDPTNNEFAGITFDGILGPAQTGVTQITTMPYYSVPLGLPLKCNAGCHSDDMRVPSTTLSAFGDWYALNTASATAKSALSGGLWADGANVGRFLIGLDQTYNNVNFNSAIRCVAEY